MKSAQVWVKAATDNHKYETTAVFNLEAIIGYEVSYEDEKLESIHLFLTSGKDRLLEADIWDDGSLTAFLEELDNHFFPPTPTDDNDIKPKEIDFYYA